MTQCFKIDRRTVEQIERFDKDGDGFDAKELGEARSALGVGWAEEGQEPSRRTRELERIFEMAAGAKPINSNLRRDFFKGFLSCEKNPRPVSTSAYFVPRSYTLPSRESHFVVRTNWDREVIRSDRSDITAEVIFVAGIDRWTQNPEQIEWSDNGQVSYASLPESGELSGNRVQMTVRYLREEEEIGREDVHFQKSADNSWEVKPESQKGVHWFDSFSTRMAPESRVIITPRRHFDPGEVKITLRINWYERPTRPEAERLKWTAIFQPTGGGSAESVSYPALPSYSSDPNERVLFEDVTFNVPDGTLIGDEGFSVTVVHTLSNAAGRPERERREAHRFERAPRLDSKIPSLRPGATVADRARIMSATLDQKRGWRYAGPSQE